LSGRVSAVYTFGSTSEGAGPVGVILSTDGNFYGATGGGGISLSGNVFKVARDGTYTVLHQFNGDGAYPYAPIEASDNNLYGTTLWNTSLGGYGTIYKYTPSGVFSTVYNFDSTHGANPESSVIQAADGNLYGTTVGGGASNCGTIFKITTSGTLLHSYSFQGGAAGCYPIGSLLQATDDNFYGTTFGDDTPADFGTIFKLSKSGGVSILYRFLGGTADGANPVDGLMQATDGNLYGTTRQGGAYGNGTIFQITPGGTYTLLYSFSSDVGANPYAAPSQHTDGLLYGTTTAGGSSGDGTLYSLDMGLGPFITFVRPKGRAGGTAQILGQGFVGTTSVTFNGVAATKFSVVSDTYMTAVVPAGATTGAVVVATPAGNLTSNVSFRITH
jgi:uncharacterized repeat protein (TIGR03803 family)